MIYFLPVFCASKVHTTPLSPPSLLYPFTSPHPHPPSPSLSYLSSLPPHFLPLTLSLPSPPLLSLHCPPPPLPPPTQWEANHAQLVLQGTRVMNILQEAISASGGPARELPRPQCIEKACTTLVSRFDKKYGGFGSAPKFPQPCEV